MSGFLFGTYLPTDWYWFVGSDDQQVWSSKYFAYVSVVDDNYQQWLSDGAHITSINPSMGDLSSVMQSQVLPLYFESATIQITSDSDANLDATYSLDAVTLDQVGSVARDVGAGLGLPLGASTWDYPDVNGTMHTFTEQNIQDLYKAMRDFISQFSTAVQTLVLGGSTALPSNAVTIP